MAGRVNNADHRAAVAGVIEASPQTAEVRTELRAIVESPAFKGSRRSQEFLRYIVENALDHHFDNLKERTLGVELFGRLPSYDTGEDAIVRVTACDVRKRLHQFYAEYGRDSEFRVELPTGSYIPEFRHVAQEPAVPLPKVASVLETVQIVSTPADGLASAPAPVENQVPVRTRRSGYRSTRVLAVVAAGLAVLAAALWFWNARRSGESDASLLRALPWSALVQPNREVRVVFCDTEIVMVQRLLDYSISLSDYANQHYWPADMKPEMRKVFQSISFRGVSVAAVDASLSLRIEHLLAAAGKHSLQMQTARSLRLADFKTEDSFILFGSPRSNPWVELFTDQLDFSFKLDPIRKAEFVQNRRPRSGEASAYVPTAEGWGTGHAYAIIALVNNPDQNGQVLLLAGSNAEATEAAGKLVARPEALAKVFKAHGINPLATNQHFEILLRVSTMAGSPNTFEVVACHALTGRSDLRK
jgi:hypothetical protein